MNRPRITLAPRDHPVDQPEDQPWNTQSLGKRGVGTADHPCTAPRRAQNILPGRHTQVVSFVRIHVGTPGRLWDAFGTPQKCKSLGKYGLGTAGRLFFTPSARKTFLPRSLDEGRPVSFP